MSKNKNSSITNNKTIIDPKKVKQRIISDQEKEKNQKDYNKKALLLFTIPLIFVIICIITYIFILNQNIAVLIVLAVVFMVFLFGFDGKRRTCPNCNKWNGLIFLDENAQTNKVKEEKKGLLGKKKIKNKKETIINSTLICENCGHIKEETKQVRH